MCQVHYNHVKGLVYEKFLPSKHQRRVITNPNLPTLTEMEQVLTAIYDNNASLESAHKLAMATNAAIKAGKPKQLLGKADSL